MPTYRRRVYVTGGNVRIPYPPHAWRAYLIGQLICATGISLIAGFILLLTQ